MAATRRLAAILAADDAGYSRLMGVDEEGTSRGAGQSENQGAHGAYCKEHQRRLLGGVCERRDAAPCAAEIQRGMADRETELTEDRRIKFRIGINLDDIIAESDDIFGDW